MFPSSLGELAEKRATVTLTQTWREAKVLLEFSII